MIAKSWPAPQPVILVKRQLETAAPDRVRVIVDNEAAWENVGRFLAAQGYNIICTQEGDIRQITATRAPANKPEAATPQSVERNIPDAEATKILVLIPAAVVGAGDDMLGAKLMKNFFGTLPELGDSLWRIILLNGGVALAAEGSPVLTELQAGSERGRHFRLRSLP